MAPISAHTVLVSVRTEAGRAELDLIRCCHSGLGVDVLQGRVLTLLRRLVSFDAAFFATADPQTLLFTGVYAEDPLDAAAQLLPGQRARRERREQVRLAGDLAHAGGLAGSGDRRRPLGQ